MAMTKDEVIEDLMITLVAGPQGKVAEITLTKAEAKMEGIVKVATPTEELIPLDMMAGHRMVGQPGTTSEAIRSEAETSHLTTNTLLTSPMISSRTSSTTATLPSTPDIDLRRGWHQKIASSKL